MPAVRRYDAADVARLGLMRNDAIDSAVVARELTYLLRRSAALYQPIMGEQILQVDSSVPAWAQHVVTQEIEGFGKEAKPAGTVGAADQDVSVTKAEKSWTQWSFVTGYRVTDDEMLRAQMTGVNVSDIKVATNLRLYRQHLDRIASIGDTRYGIPGLCTNTAVLGDSSGSVAGTGNGGWIGPANKAPSGAATYAWALVTAKDALRSMILGMSKDVSLLCNAVWTASKQNYTVDTVLVPLSYWPYMTQQFFPDSGRTALDIVKSNNPTVSRIMPWLPLATASNTGAARLVGFDSRDPRVARLSISRRLFDDVPQRLTEGFGIKVPQKYTVAGVMIEMPSGIAYLDIA